VCSDFIALYRIYLRMTSFIDPQTAIAKKRSDPGDWRYTQPSFYVSITNVSVLLRFKINFLKF